MKICIAQTQSAIGDIATNIARHNALIELAAFELVDIIIFPELSLTGYQPELADELATSKDDQRFEVLQQASDHHNMIIGVGVPLHSSNGISISMVLFFPELPREVYTKNYLHEDEEPFFVPGQSTCSALGDQNEIALAICYEIAVPDHARNASAAGAKYYLASVAKTHSGVEKASTRLSEIAGKYGMTVLMANCTGTCEGQDAGGKSGIWNNREELISQLDDQKEGLIIFDTETGTCLQKSI